MPKKKRAVEPLETIWEAPDELWKKVELVLDELDPPAATGRRRVDMRKALNGIINQLRTGCQWIALSGEFGDDSSVHRTLQCWIAKDVFKLLWSILIGECDELGGVNVEWQSADGAMGKARSGGIVWAETPRIVAKTARSAA